jgi:hypothetical protein
VQLLLDNKADVNAQGGHYGNALKAAISVGDPAIVRILRRHPDLEEEDLGPDSDTEWDSETDSEFE